jgi:hypothetical protein
MRKSGFIAGLVGLVSLWPLATPGYADPYDVALKAIADTADRICGTVSTSGDSQSMKATGEVRAQLSGLARHLTELGINGAGSIDNDAYVGVLRSDLPTALNSMQECKLKVFQALEQKLIMGVNQSGSTTQPKQPTVDPATHGPANAN